MRKSWLLALLLVSVFLISNVLAVEECYYNHNAPYSHIKYTDDGAGRNTGYSVYWYGDLLKTVASIPAANFSFTKNNRLVIGNYAYWAGEWRDTDPGKSYYEVCRTPVVSSCSSSNFDWNQMQASDICDNGVSLNTFTNGDTPCRQPSSSVYKDGVLITASTCTDIYKKQQMTLNCIFTLSNNSYEFNRNFITKDTSVKLSGGTRDFIINGEMCSVLNAGYTYSSYYDCTTPQNTCHIPNSLAGTKILGNVSAKEYFTGFMVNMTCNGVNRQYRWVTGYALLNDSTRNIKWNPVSESNAQAFFGYNTTKFYNQVCTDQADYNFGGMYTVKGVCNNNHNFAVNNPITGTASCPNGYVAYGVENFSTGISASNSCDWYSFVCLGNVSTTSKIMLFGGMYTLQYYKPADAVNNTVTNAPSCPVGYQNLTAFRYTDYSTDETTAMRSLPTYYCYTTDLSKPQAINFGGFYSLTGKCQDSCIGTSSNNYNGIINPFSGDYRCSSGFLDRGIAWISGIIDTAPYPTLGIRLCYSNIVCGNGVIESVEECDDGNSISNDGCSSSCKINQQYFIDSDGDSFGNIDSFIFSSSVPSGYSSNADDCDDSNALVNPNIVEICNGIDDNCDGEIDSYGGVGLCSIFSTNLSFLDMDGGNFSSAAPDLKDDVILFFGNDTNGVNYNASLYKNDTTVSLVKNFSTNKSFVVWKANVTGNYFFKITSNNGASWKMSANRFVNVSVNDSAPSVEVKNKDNPNLNYSVGANVDFLQFTHDVDDLLGLNWTFGDGGSYDVTNYSYFEKAYNNSVLGNAAHSYSSKGVYRACLTATENDLGSSKADCLNLVVFGPGINVIPIITNPKNMESSGSQWIYFNASQTYVVNCSASSVGGYNFTTVDGGLYCKYIHAPGSNKTTATYDLTFSWNMGDGRTTNGDLDNNYNTAVVFKYKYDDSGKHSASLNVKYVGS